MSSTISLQSSVKTCQVDVGWANRIQSDRFQNPNNMVCVPWDGRDLAGRTVAPDSWYTKTPGCNSAEDRVLVENDQRPKYFNYVTLSAGGVDGSIYGNVSAEVDSANRNQWLMDRKKVTGGFNNDFDASTNPVQKSCTLNAYERSMAQMAQYGRAQNALQNGFKGASYSSCGGNR